MQEVLDQLEAIRASLVAQAVQTLQNDGDLEVQVVVALPKVRGLIQTLKQIQAQAAQVPAQ